MQVIPKSSAYPPEKSFPKHPPSDVHRSTYDPGTRRYAPVDLLMDEIIEYATARPAYRHYEVAGHNPRLGKKVLNEEKCCLPTVLQDVYEAHGYLKQAA